MLIFYVPLFMYCSLHRYHNNAVIQTGGRISIKTSLVGADQYQLTLQISGPIDGSTDAGVYRVHAKNSKGESNANMTLNLGNVGLVS